MDISDVAREFIGLNQRRREIERQEEYLKGILVEHFRTTRSNCLETDLGKVSYVEAQRVEYDIPLLRETLPEDIFSLVAKVSVDDALLAKLISDGKLDPRDIERARKVTPVYRVVVQARAGVSQVEPVPSAGRVAPPLRQGSSPAEVPARGAPAGPRPRRPPIHPSPLSPRAGPARPPGKRAERRER